MSGKETSDKTNVDEWRDKLEKELAIWKDALHRENTMLEKMISSFDALEEKMKKKKEEKSEPFSGF